MISAGEFRNGVTFDMDGKVMQVVEFQHVKPGKGAAFVRVKMKNVITGAVTETSFNPTAKFPTAFVERKKMEYSYNDGSLYYFMDLTLFARHIAPALHIVRRFVGEEPFSPTTAAYNRRMKEILPTYGVSVTEIPRLENISATAVRRLLAEGRLADIQPLVPETTYAYCQRHFGGRPPRP